MRGTFFFLHCQRLSDLSSVDDPYLSLLFINSVRGVDTATEHGDSGMLALAIYSLLIHTARTTSFLSPSHILVPSVKMHTYHTPSSLVPSMDILQGKLGKDRRGGGGGIYQIIMDTGSQLWSITLT